MKEKKPFVANKNHFYIFFGLALVLFSIIMVLNIGYVARYVSTPFTYALGSASYLLYIALNLLGIRLIFVKKFLKIKINLYFAATIVLIVSGLMFLTHFMSVDKFSGYIALTTEEGKSINFFEAFQKVIVDSRYYNDTNFLSLISHPFGAGLLGYVLVALFNALFGIKNGGFIIAIVLAVLALILYFLPLTLNLIGQSKPVTKKEEKETISDTSSPKQNQQKVHNIDVVKHASEIDPSDYHSEITGAPNRSAAMSSPTFVQQDSGANNFTIGDNGMFVPARFRTDNGQHGQEEPVNAMRQVDFPNQNQEPAIPESNPVQEQLSLDFGEQEQQPVQPTPSLAAAKPVFEAPKPVQSTPIQPQQQFAQPQQPVVEQPKPKPRVKWIQPSTEVLNTYETSEQLENNKRAAEERKEVINSVFTDFGIGARVEDYTIGPSVTRFNVKYDHNVSVRSVSNMVQDIQIRLSGVSARFENIVEGQSTSGLEIPNVNITTVSFKDVYEALPDVKKHPLAVAFGKNIKGDVIYADFDEFPHALVAGTTGSGKSIFVNSVIVSLIMRNSPDDLKMVLVDPKKVEMSRYKDMPHLLCPIITDAQEAKCLMDKLCEEMENRYLLFAEHGCSNIKEFNEDAPGLGLDKLPYIMIFFDEYADMVDQCKEISMPVVSIAQKARACGIHMCIATQRPSTNVVTGVIKANLPTHVALMMASYTDSMTIIGEGGAEKLIGKGDMLVQSPLVSRIGCVRLQGCFIHRQEINRVVGYLKEHYPTVYDEKYLNLAQSAEVAASEYANTPEFKEAAGNSEEERYQSIKEWVMTQEFMSISRIQRECSVGFNRAGRFFLRLQNEGVVSKETTNKGCPVLASGGRFGDETVVTSDEQTSFRSDD